MTETAENPTRDRAAEAIEIARLAALDDLEYEHERQAAAERLGIARISTLDRLVMAARIKAGIATGKAEPAAFGRPVTIEDGEAWPDRVDGNDLLTELARVVRRYVIMPEVAADAVALWIVHTYAFNVATITPRLAIKSAQKRSGKTTLLNIIEALCARPLSTANITAAAVYRTVELASPTLLIDEADTFLAERDELRGVLNAGFMRGGEVIRIIGDDHEPRRFSCWCPVAIAAIRRLPDTLEDRAVAITLQRRHRDEHRARLRSRDLGLLEPLARQCRRWALDHLPRLEIAEPTLPNQLHDRAVDCWEPLVAIADLAGGRWSERARLAALELSEANDDAETTATRLLADLRELFAGEASDVLFSEEITAALGKMENRPWPEWKAGKPISKVQIARLLSQFKTPLGIPIRPETVRREAVRAKGYTRDKFTDAFKRYLAPAWPPTAPEAEAE
jgi:putative DNA primase/helicase